MNDAADHDALTFWEGIYRDASPETSGQMSAALRAQTNSMFNS